MSLFDTFDPGSEEILKPLVRPADGFPETVVMTFEEKSLQALKSLCKTETAAVLKGGRDIPVYKFRWNGRELGLPCVKGRTWTTDALYRETRNNMEKRRADGCIAVEMECASVMAVGQFRGAAVYQFLYAEDSLDGDAWDARTWGAVPASDYEKYLRIALEAASRL